MDSDALSFLSLLDNNDGNLPLENVKNLYAIYYSVSNPGGTSAIRAILYIYTHCYNPFLRHAESSSPGLY